MYVESSEEQQNRRDLFLGTGCERRSNCREKRKISFNTGKEKDEAAKTGRNLNQTWRDIRTHQHHLYHTVGSIDMPTYLLLDTQCSCQVKPPSEIQQQIFAFENELSQKDYVEYMYKIDSIKSSSLMHQI